MALHKSYDRYHPSPEQLVRPEDLENPSDSDNGIIPEWDDEFKGPAVLHKTDTSRQYEADDELALDELCFE